jgi:hypothetical protein
MTRTPQLSFPTTPFIFRPDGPRVATVNGQNLIHWQTIRVGRDFGPDGSPLDGLEPNTRVVRNPTNDLREGVEVVVQSLQPK